MTTALPICFVLAFPTRSTSCSAGFAEEHDDPEGCTCAAAGCAPGCIRVRRRGRELAEECSRPRSREDKSVSRPAGRDRRRAQDFCRPLFSLSWRKCRGHEETSAAKKRTRAATGHGRRSALAAGEWKYAEGHAVVGQAARSATLAGDCVREVAPRIACSGGGWNIAEQKTCTYRVPCIDCNLFRHRLSLK